MVDSAFLQDYFNQFKMALEQSDTFETILSVKDAMVSTSSKGNKVMMAGNGASASMASHFALDFTKQAKIKTLSFNNASLITAYANDFGYEHWVEKAIEHHGEAGDLAILISSSGSSKNLVNAAEVAKKSNMTVVTFTGFKEDNPLKTKGDINLWVNSKAYNIIESTHSFWLAALCDSIIGKTEYSVS